MEDNGYEQLFETAILQNIFCFQHKEETHSGRGSVNDNWIFIFGWTIPLNTEFMQWDQPNLMKKHAKPNISRA